MEASLGVRSKAREGGLQRKAKGRREDRALTVGLGRSSFKRVWVGGKETRLDLTMSYCLWSQSTI